MGEEWIEEECIGEERIEGKGIGEEGVDEGPPASSTTSSQRLPAFSRQTDQSIIAEACQTHEEAAIVTRHSDPPFSSRRERCWPSLSKYLTDGELSE